MFTWVPIVHYLTRCVLSSTPQDSDLKRTVGINTGHIGTTDFVLEPEDVQFIIARGRNSLEAFLKYYVAQHNLKKKPEYRQIKNLGSLDSESYNGSVDSLNLPYNPNRRKSDDADLRRAAFRANGVEIPNSLELKEKPPADPVKRLRSPCSGKSVCISNHVHVIENNYDDVYEGNSDEEENKKSVANIYDDVYEGNSDEETNIDHRDSLDGRKPPDFQDSPDHQDSATQDDSEDSPQESRVRQDEILRLLRRTGPSSTRNNTNLKRSRSDTGYKNVSKKDKLAKRRAERRHLTVNVNLDKSDIVVHKQPETADSPRTPLLTDIREDSFEVRPSDSQLWS